MKHVSIHIAIERRIAVTAHMVPRLVIGHDQQNIRAVLFLLLLRQEKKKTSINNDNANNL